jgi:hypothetical protein
VAYVFHSGSQICGKWQSAADLTAGQLLDEKSS